MKKLGLNQFTTFLTFLCWLLTRETTNPLIESLHLESTEERDRKVKEKAPKQEEGGKCNTLPLTVQCSASRI